MMKKSYFRKRNSDAITNLEKGLSQRYQRSFKNPQKELRRISSSLSLMSSMNHQTRNFIFSRLVDGLYEELGKENNGDFRKPLYFMTISDKGQARKILKTSKARPEGRKCGPSVKDACRFYRRLARVLSAEGVTCFGFIEPALIVSAHDVFHCSRMFCYHVHLLIWKTPETYRRSAEKRLRKLLTPLINRSTTVCTEDVAKSDLMQMAWYTSKIPYRQTQFGFDKECRIVSRKRICQPINSVRYYKELRDIDLRDLCVATRWGKKIKAEIFAAFDRRFGGR